MSKFFRELKTRKKFCAISEPPQGFSFKKNAWGLQPLEVGVSLFEAVADVVCLAVARDWPIWKFTARMEISGRRAHVESREGAADTQAGQNFA